MTSVVIVAEGSSSGSIARSRLDRLPPAANVDDTGVAGEISAAMIATACTTPDAGGVRYAARMIGVARETVVAPINGAGLPSSMEWTRRRTPATVRSSGAEKRAPPPPIWGGRPIESAMLLWISLGYPCGAVVESLGADCAGPEPHAGPPSKTIPRPARRRDGGAWLVAFPCCVAHDVEEKKAHPTLLAGAAMARRALHSGVARWGIRRTPDRLHQQRKRWERGPSPSRISRSASGYEMAFQRGEAVENKNPATSWFLRGSWMSSQLPDGVRSALLYGVPISSGKGD